MSRSVETIENEIEKIKNSNPNWITSDIDKGLITALTNEKNILQTSSDIMFEIVMDKRLKLFLDEGESNVQSLSSFKKKVRNKYGNRCLLCSSEKANAAHLISHNSETNYSDFGPPKYTDALSLDSIRNRILLCGNKGEKGTCHDKFNNHIVALLYESLALKYFWFEIATDHTIIKTEVIFPTYLKATEYPYKRLLAWRLRRFALKWPWASVLSRDVISTFITIADMSEDVEKIKINTSQSSYITSDISEMNISDNDEGVALNFPKSVQ